MATDKRQFVDLASVSIAPDVIKLIPECVARKHCVLPLVAEKGPVHMALSDPADRERIDQLEFFLGRSLVPVVAPREAILQAIDRHYGVDKEDAKRRAEVELSGPAKAAQQGSGARRFLMRVLLLGMSEHGRRFQVWRRGEETELYGWLPDGVSPFVPPEPNLVDRLADELGRLGVRGWRNWLKGKMPALHYGVYRVDLGIESVPVRYEVAVLPDGVSIGLEFTTTPAQAQWARAISDELDYDVLKQRLDNFEDGPR